MLGSAFGQHHSLLSAPVALQCARLSQIPAGRSCHQQERQDLEPAPHTSCPSHCWVQGRGVLGVHHTAGCSPYWGASRALLPLPEPCHFSARGGTCLWNKGFIPRELAPDSAFRESGFSFWRWPFKGDNSDKDSDKGRGGSSHFLSFSVFGFAFCCCCCFFLFLCFFYMHRCGLGVVMLDFCFCFFSV